MGMETTHRTAQDRISIAQDRISDLPDCVLLHMLSLLDDTKEVVKTSVLSKRWQYVWTSIPTLTFRVSRPNNVFYHMILVKWVKWVNQTLLNYRSSRIEKLKIVFDEPDQFRRDVYSWLQFAVRKKVKDLTISFPHFTYSLPLFVLHCSSFEKFSVWGCDWKSSWPLSWKSLKSLTIGHTAVNNDILKDILDGSPMLEHLKISECRSIIDLQVNSENLREFDIDYSFCEIGNGTLNISAPRLESLRLSETKFIQVQLLSVSSLLKVVLDISLYDEEDDWSYLIQNGYINGLLGNLDRAVELELGLDSTLAMVLWFANPILSSRLLHLKCLKLKDYTPQASIPGIISILRSAPNIEKLIVDTGPTRRVKSMCPLFYTILDYFWFEETSVENHPLPHLKTVKFRCFENLGDADVYTRKLVELLQENAPLLGKTGVIMGRK